MDRGEKHSNFSCCGEDDLVVGDRAYGTLPGIQYLREQGSGYVLRLRGKAFKVYDQEGKEVSIIGLFQGLTEGEGGSIQVYGRIGGSPVPVPQRICALRKDPDRERAGMRRLKKANQRKRKGKEVSEAPSEYNQYIIGVTSLGQEVTAAQVQELYRIRWQIELVFKRLKSLFGYGQIPVKEDASIQAWFYGKLLLAALGETIVNKGRFSPL